MWANKKCAWLSCFYVTHICISGILGDATSKSIQTCLSIKGLHSTLKFHGSSAPSWNDLLLFVVIAGSACCNREANTRWMHILDASQGDISISKSRENQWWIHWNVVLIKCCKILYLKLLNIIRVCAVLTRTEMK